MAGKNKRERLHLILAEMEANPAASTADEARALLARVMNTVEDGESGVEANPDADVDDGRMYPPADRYERAEPKPGVRLFRVKAHRVYFGGNGAILITDLNDKILLDKPGADGRLVADL